MPATDSKMGYTCFEMQETEINGLADMQKAVEGDIEGWDCTAMMRARFMDYCLLLW